MVFVGLYNIFKMIIDKKDNIVYFRHIEINEVKMTFKEKHFKQAFGPLLLSAMMILPTGCGKPNKNYEVEDNELGLLDPTPIEQIDNYGDKVKLSHVQIPVYNKDGERLKDQWVLTHGVANTVYVPDTSRVRLRATHLNNNPKTDYVMVDANGAILTENGGCGLFLEGMDILVVANANLDKFVGERTVQIVRTYNRVQKNKQVVATDTVKTKPEHKEINPTDMEKKDSLLQAPDTTKNLNFSILKADTISIAD